MPATTAAAVPTVSAVPLTTLSQGATAVLHAIADARSHAVLRSLGLTGGATFRLCRMGDPCIIQVRSTRIGLSRAVAESVLVTTAGAPV
jgi:Fe2+ transport system protein FeoA